MAHCWRWRCNNVNMKSRAIAFRFKLCRTRRFQSFGGVSPTISLKTESVLASFQRQSNISFSQKPMRRFLAFTGLWRMPKILDAVETVLGPNLLVWDSGWFAKMPGDKKYVAWHQDGIYFGLHPPNVVTAWVALTDSTPENGCLRVVPGSHGKNLIHRETGAPDNALSRGQEIAVEVDESQAVDIVLQPGELSLHHVGIVHGSNPNTSDRPRIGLAIRYLTPDVVHHGPERQLALLVRGKDEFGHFELLDRPIGDSAPAGRAIQLKILERMGVKG